MGFFAVDGHAIVHGVHGRLDGVITEIGECRECAARLHVGREAGHHARHALQVEAARCAGCVDVVGHGKMAIAICVGA